MSPIHMPAAPAQAGRRTHRARWLPGLLAALCSAAACATGPQPPGAEAARQLAAGLPGVQWQRGGLVVADFNGDGRPDVALLGRVSDGVVVAVRVASPHRGGHRDSHLRFGIGADRHDAICALPARLTTDPLRCRPVDAPLPGCRPSPRARALALRGGECDAIHLYWNHQTGTMAWWRP